MSIDELIVSAVTPIVSVCVPVVYDGEADIYCTFNYNEIPVSHGDNAPEAVRYLVQVHLFTPIGTNAATLRRRIKNALLGIGCTYPTATNMSDADGQHWILECDYVDGDV